MEYKCDYCNSMFATKTNMLKHQRNAKYCLKLQGKEIDPQSFVCSCGHTYTHIDSFNRHKKTCVVVEDEIDTCGSGGSSNDKYEQIINTMTEMHTTILHKMMDIMTVNGNTSSNGNGNNGSEPRNVNVMTNGLTPITDANLQEHLEKLSLYFIQAGARGYANFANSYTLKDNIVCTDKSRRKIRYKNEHGILTDDSRSLTRRFFKAIKPRNEKVINDEYTQLHNQIKTIVANNKTGDVDITALITRAAGLQTILVQCREAAEGLDNDFTQDFLKYLARAL